MTDGTDQTENPLIARLREELGSNITNVSSPRKRRVILEATSETYRDVIRYLQEKLDCYHLSMINGVDLKTSFEVVYHFCSDDKGMFSLKVSVPRDKPVIGSVVDMVPAAVLYEREVYDLFGIYFEDHPDLRRLVLSDDWPIGEHPLRKDWKPGEKKMYCLVKSAEMKAAKRGDGSA